MKKQLLVLAVGIAFMAGSFGLGRFVERLSQSLAKEAAFANHLRKEMGSFDNPCRHFDRLVKNSGFVIDELKSKGIVRLLSVAPGTKRLTISIMDQKHDQFLDTFETCP